jgi:hypothetical protein
MVGLLANRKQFGLILPSTNTSVEAEFNRMLVPGTYTDERIIQSNLLIVHQVYHGIVGVSSSPTRISAQAKLWWHFWRTYVFR